MAITAMSVRTVEYFRGAAGTDGRSEWFVRAKAHNGETVFVTEGYSRKWSAKRAARAIAQAFAADCRQAYPFDTTGAR